MNHLRHIYTEYIITSKVFWRSICVSPYYIYIFSNIEIINVSFDGNNVGLHLYSAFHGL